MSAEEERINELLFVLRRDFTISKEMSCFLSLEEILQLVKK